MPHDNESRYTPLHVGHNAGTCPRRTIGLPPTPLPCTSGRLWWMSLWDGQSELKPSVVTDSILSPGKQPKTYQNYCPHGGWKLNSPTSLDNRYNSLVVSIHYWKIHLDNFVSSNPSVANGCCCHQGPEWQPGGALYNYSRGIDTRWVNGLDDE